MLHAPQFAVRIRSRHTHARGQQPHLLGALQQRDVAHIAHQLRVVCRLREHQVLHGKLRIHHAARTVFHIELPVARGVRCAHTLAHGHDFLTQGGRVAFGGDNGLPHGIEARLQGLAAHHKTRACHGLVLPGPRGVAAPALLVVGVGLEARDQQT